MMILLLPAFQNLVILHTVLLLGYAANKETIDSTCFFKITRGLQPPQGVYYTIRYYMMRYNTLIFNMHDSGTDVMGHSWVCACLPFISGVQCTVVHQWVQSEMVFHNPK